MKKLQIALEIGGSCRFKKMYLIIKSLLEVIQEKRHKREFKQFIEHSDFLKRSYKSLKSVYGKSNFFPNLMPIETIVKDISEIEIEFCKLFLSDEVTLESNCILMYKALKETNNRFESFDHIRKDFLSFQNKAKTKKEFSKSFLHHIEFH